MTLMVVRLVLSFVLAYLAAYGSRGWLFLVLVLVSLGIEGQYWINRRRLW